MEDHQEQTPRNSQGDGRLELFWAQKYQLLLENGLELPRWKPPRIQDGAGATREVLAPEGYEGKDDGSPLSKVRTKIFS